MDKKKIEIAATSILVLFLVFLVVNTTRKRKPSKRVPSSVSAQKVAEDSVITKTAGADKDIIALQKKRAELSWGRDPFFFAKEKKVYKGTAIILKGVSLGKDRRGFAFINDQIVTVGDAVAGHRVLEIQKDRVLLRRNSGDSFYLGLSEE